MLNAKSFDFHTRQAHIIVEIFRQGELLNFTEQFVEDLVGRQGRLFSHAQQEPFLSEFLANQPGVASIVLDQQDLETPGQDVGSRLRGSQVRLFGNYFHHSKSFLRAACFGRHDPFEELTSASARRNQRFPHDSVGFFAPRECEKKRRAAHQLQITGHHSQRLGQVVRRRESELLQLGIRALQFGSGALELFLRAFAVY
jgi:hypothetical protein